MGIVAPCLIRGNHWILLVLQFKYKTITFINTLSVSRLIRLTHILALLCLALPCLAVPCRALPCLAVPCPVLPCLAVPCLALAHTLPCHAWLTHCLVLPLTHPLPCCAMPNLRSGMVYGRVATSLRLCRSIQRSSSKWKWRHSPSLT